MTHPIIKTDNYILITSDEEIKIGDIVLETYVDGTKGLEQIDTLNDIHPLLHKKVIAHLPLNNSPILEGLPLLPPLPNEEDVEKLAELNGHPESSQFYDYKEGFIDGFLEAKEKYKFTEEDIRKAIAIGYDWCHQKHIPNNWMIDNFIQSLSQPKLPVGFKCEMEEIAIGGFIEGVDEAVTVDKKIEPKIINGVMQGEWIFE